MTRDGETQTCVLNSPPQSTVIPWQLPKQLSGIPGVVPLLQFNRRPVWPGVLAMLQEEQKKMFESCMAATPARISPAMSVDIQKIKLKSGRPLKKPSFPIKLIWCKDVVCLMDGDHEVPITIDEDNSPPDSVPNTLTGEEEYWYNCCQDSKKNRAKHYKELKSTFANVESMIEYICGIDRCMRTFSSRNEVVDHVFGVHHLCPAMTYKCCWPDCEREGSFAQFYQIEVHMLQHRQERPYRCQEEGCSKSYRRMENLRTHMRCHSGEKPYECKFEGCGRAFTNASDRAKHENRTHSTEKMFVCEEEKCGKSYTDPSSLRKHMINAHGKERYEAHKMSKQHARKRKAEDAQRSHSVSIGSTSPSSSNSPDGHLAGLIRPEPVKRGFFVSDLLQRPVLPSPPMFPPPMMNLLPFLASQNATIPFLLDTNVLRNFC